MREAKRAAFHCLFILAVLLLDGCATESPDPGGIPGTGSLSGSVSAPETFQAARVYAENLDRRMLYMVYTGGGSYRAINLLPGRYQIWAAKKGFESAPPREIRIETGDHLEVDFSLTQADARSTTLGHSSARFGGRIGDEIPLVPYDELYPEGPGRDLAERTCVVCHGQNFLPSHQWTTVEWAAAITRMMDPDTRQGPTLVEGNAVGTLSTEEHQVLSEYLGEHFGPDSQRWALEIDVEIPIDEEQLSKAMFIEYFLPEGRHAHDPAIDHEGNVWYSDNAVPTRISKLDPRAAEFTEYDLPEPESYPEGLIVDSQGYVIWCEPGGGVLGRLDVETGEIERFPHGVPAGRAHTPVEDENGDIWFTMIIGNRIGKWDRTTDEIRVWEIPTPNSFPYGIVAQDGRVWFAEFFGGKVGMFDAATEQFTEYPTLAQPSSIRRVGIDSGGTTVWYGVFNGAKVGKIDVRTGQQVEYDLPAYAGPYDVWPDNDDQVWISDGVLGGELIRLDPETEQMTYYPLPRKTDVPKLDVSREGAVWYATRSNPEVAVGVLWPDVSLMTEFAAHRR